jgi:5'-3' exonuclease
MGVPSFFKYLLDQYKKNDFIIQKEIQDKKTQDKLNSIEYLMLDANGLMHPVCFKVVAENPTITDNDKLETLMHRAILDYIDHMIDYVKPTKGVYIAIDGVAPVAKVKQQRYRRFKSVHDNKLWDSIKKKHNKPIGHFWNNSVITPGTEFMNRLHIKILDWMKTKDIEIVYSSCYMPGEGEHKLMDFIRLNNTNSYIIYGLDADLIFLSLATGLNNLYLLREANEINNKESQGILKYVSIDVLRMVIPDTMKKFIMKIDSFKTFNYDNINDNNLINDFIFLCYFLGNDFLPHIYAIDINKEGIEYLLKEYATVFINLSKPEYIIDKKHNINQKLLVKLLEGLSSKEEEILKSNYNKKKHYRVILSDEYEREKSRIENLNFSIYDPIKVGSDNFTNWHKRFYKHYFAINDNIEMNEFSNKIVEHYITGLKWVTQYYFIKCPAWEWYYPFDQAPFLNDIYNHINNIKINRIKLSIGKPLTPYVQLLSVLPPQSSNILPRELQHLMHDKHSDIIYLYPTDFEQDFISKDKYWKGIPQLPPLDVGLVNKVYNRYKKRLITKPERHTLFYNK